MAKEIKAVNFGNGRLSGIMSDVHENSIRVLNLSKAQAERFARQLGCDLGKIEKMNVSKVKIGAIGKSGNTSLRATLNTLKGVPLTYSLSIAKALEFAIEMRKCGVIDTRVTFRKNIESWLNDEKEPTEELPTEETETEVVPA